MTNRTAMLSIGELARHVGVTVRAVRLYEGAGLLASTRAENGRRMFAAASVSRLELIVALKRIGLTLAECRQVLTQDADALAEIVNDRLQALARKRNDLEWSIAGLLAARDHQVRDGALDPEALVGLLGATEELKLGPHDPRVGRYYDKRQMIRLHRRRPGRTRHAQTTADWDALMSEIEALAVSGEPLSAAAQNAAARFSKFGDDFAMGDADIIASLRRQEQDATAHYETVPAADEALRAGPSALSKRGWLFIRRALDAFREAA